MKCRDIKLWLLSSRERDPLPSTIRRHLEKCARCRNHQHALTQVDQRVAMLPVLPASPAAKERFLKVLEGAPGPTVKPPQPLAPEPKRPPIPRSRRLALPLGGAGAIAACVLLGVGWFLGRGSVKLPNEQAHMPPLPKEFPKNQTLPPQPAKPQSAKIDVDRPEHVGILVRIMKHNTRLAETYDLEEQLQHLEAMADDLKTEIIRLVKRASFDEGHAVTELYAMVVRDGVLLRAARMPADKKSATSKRLIEHFQKSIAEIDALRPDQALARSVLADLRSTAVDATKQLGGEGSTSLVQSADRSVGTRPLLQTLVVRGMTLASEPDPLNRADLCSEIAARVAPSVILLSAGAGPENADLVGDSINELLERGVAGNLEKMERELGKDAFQRDAAKVRERTKNAWNALETELADVPGGQQNDVKRMIAASAPGVDRVAFPGKGKGAVSKRNDEKFFPPGLQKKNQKQ